MALIYVPLSAARQPRSGNVLVDYFWVYRKFQVRSPENVEEALAFYRLSSLPDHPPLDFDNIELSPQCNLNREITERLGSHIYGEDHGVIPMPIVFMTSVHYWLLQNWERRAEFTRIKLPNKEPNL